MEIFGLTIDVMLMMFVLILVGFILRKAKILPEGMSDVTMARLETYALVPALNFYNWSTNCTVKSLKENAILIVYGLVIISIAILCAYPLSGLFVKKSSEDKAKAYQRNIYKYAMAFGNYGFLGNFVVLGIFGNEGLFKYSMFTLTMSFIINSWGIYVLIPKDKKPSIKTLIRKMLNPPIVSIFLGGICGLLGFTEHMPDFLVRALSNAGNCMGPIAMILAGFVIGGYEFKELLKNKKVYFATVFRLILIPVVILTIFRFLVKVDDFTLTLILVAFGAPFGLNTIVYPATYGGETRTGAAMAMISHTFALITVPLLYYIFVVKL